jgi:transcriptional regulator with XRE-family HTH domain
MTKLKAMRLAKGWTQQDLGYHAQIQGSDVSKIERGWTKPYPSQAARLAAVLGLAPDELLDEMSQRELEEAINVCVDERVNYDETVARA